MDRKNEKKIRWSAKLNSNKASSRDKTMYCRFHKDYKHTIEECRELKDEIERLIRDGSLRRFARKDREERKAKLEIRNPVSFNENEPLDLYM